MADFDLTQTDAQVQSILNDGQNMQGAGAQTTLTTESVLLKDVNGNYHKILKSSFTEAIRDTLAGLLINNDKGTTINQIAAIASGDFGSITPANLASVLGVKSGTAWNSSETPSFITAPLPNLATPYFATQFGGDDYCIQTVANNLVVMQREIINGAVGSWKRTDNFGCNTLAELKAALANV